VVDERTLEVSKSKTVNGTAKKRQRAEHHDKCERSGQFQCSQGAIKHGVSPKSKQKGTRTAKK
jgi:hypothetical protein